MPGKPTCEELEQRVKELEKECCERKRGEGTLRHSEEKYRFLYESALVAMFTTTIELGTALAVNDEGFRLFGYSSKEKFIIDFVVEEHYADPDGRNKLLNELKLKGEAHKRQSKFIRKDGMPVWVEFYARTYPNKGWVEFAAIDITDRKRAQEALLESEKRLYREQERMRILKLANDLALKLMDELRNPLVAIGGFSRLISSRDYPENKLKQYTKIIFEQSMRLDNVMEEILVHLKAAAEQV